MNLDEMMAALGYTSDWLRSGIVDVASVEAQYNEWLDGDDKNQEHFRHRAFLAFLRSKRALLDSEVAEVLLLKDAGPDGCDMSKNRIIDLIVSGVLSDEQHFALADKEVVLQSPIDKRYRRESLLRRMRRDGLTHELFEEIGRSDDAPVQLAAIALASREHLVWLQHHGASMAVRNQAKQLLRRSNSS